MNEQDMITDMFGREVRKGDVVLYAAQSGHLVHLSPYIVHYVSRSTSVRPHWAIDETTGRGEWRDGPVEDIDVRLRGFKYDWWDKVNEKSPSTYVRTILRTDELVKIDPARLDMNKPENVLLRTILAAKYKQGKL